MAFAALARAGAAARARRAAAAARGGARGVGLRRVGEADYVIVGAGSAGALRIA